MMITNEMKKGLIAGVALYVILVCALLTTTFFKDLFSVRSRSGQYAVFLTNGQVYFGTIAREDAKQLLLKNIYYIQFKGDEKDALASQSDVSLLKLGNELHGPEDWMEINRDAILFLERLRPDGNVAKAIDAYGKK